MSKMKQATLFSLKSWKNVTADEISKYKNILDNHHEAMSVLKALITLKRMNPSKDILLSTGLDCSLKKMTKHPNSSVSMEANKLLVYWKLEDISSAKGEANDQSQKRLLEKTKPKVISDSLKELNMTNTISENNKDTHFNGSVGETIDKDEVVIEKMCQKHDDNLKVCQSSNTDTSSQIYTLQIKKQNSKKQAIKNLKKREVTIRLQDAIKLFVEEVGKQEVEMYLKALD